MPETARHLILGGAQGASGGAVADTAPAYWLSEFAEETSAAAYPYIAVGQNGTLQDLTTNADALTPTWSVGAPLDAWPDLSGEDNFSVWIQPETDIQFDAPTKPYGSNPQSALDTVLALIDSVQKTTPGAAITLFEDWADTTIFLNNGMLSDAARTLYFDFVQNAYHDWFETLVAELQAARPEIDITLMPTASTLAALANTAPFGDLAMTLMPDNPADGAAARALLSGAVGYATSFDAPLPVTSTLATKADAALEPLYPELSKAISTAVLGDLPPDPDPDPEPDPINITGTDGADVLALYATLQNADLGDGFDTVTVNATRDDANVLFGAGNTVFVSLPGDSSPAAIHNAERLEFQDGTLALDIDGIAGQAYRLYQASFDRTPDAEGLGFWIDALDSNKVSLEEAAEFFMQSAEFEAAYGSPDTVTDTLFLTLLYVNALDRPPDEDGFVYWRDQQDQGVTRAEMMVYFSESVENTAQVAPTIADGIWYF